MVKSGAKGAPEDIKESNKKTRLKFDTRSILKDGVNFK